MGIRGAGVNIRVQEWLISYLVYDDACIMVAGVVDLLPCL